MKAICYKNTKTTLPGWNEPIHEKEELGYAYESGKHFIHIYGKGFGVYTISPGLTTCEKRNGTLEDWVKNTFGAKDIISMKEDVGCAKKSIWRPGLYDESETMQALDYDSFELRNSEIKLKMLLDELSEIFLYVEPSTYNLNVYGHKIRRLLIISCTEVENHLMAILRKSSLVSGNVRYSTRNYVKLRDIAHLEEYSVLYRNYKDLSKIQPFKGWDENNPTKSLPWYDAYNQTKHNSDLNFSKAKLIHILESVAANIILHCVRFGPYGLYNSRNELSASINQYVSISLENPDISSFYIPNVVLPPNTREDIFTYDSYRDNDIQPWNNINIVI